MPGCPPKTCETLSVSGRLEELCGNGTTCQEGCRPKPCPPGFVFDNERDMNCVHEAHCKVPCKEIYGKLYLEGERIADERVAEPCESCGYCGPRSVVDIECRVTSSGVAAMKAGQSVTCELPRGLACYHRDQANGTCLDYEVRLLCDCGEWIVGVIL
ncbi:unnamed protein product [Ixodes persulcatus]